MICYEWILKLRQYSRPGENAIRKPNIKRTEPMAFDLKLSTLLDH